MYMVYLRKSALVLAALSVTACSISVPKTTTAFRKADSHVERETIKSRLSYSKLAGILRDRFDKCMNIKITTDHGGSSIVQLFRPTTRFGKSSGTAILQVDTTYEGSMTIGEYEMPPGGRYVILADVKKKGSGSEISMVMVDDYSPDDDISEVTTKMIKTWSKGDMLDACPNY